MNSLLAEFTDSKGENKYKAQAENKFNTYMNYSRQYSTNNNTIYMSLSASGSGNWLDQRSGWMTASIDAEIICLGDTNPEKLAASILSNSGVPVGKSKPVMFKNNCDKNVDLALTWRTPAQEWITIGWWKFKPGEGSILTNNGRRVQSDVDNLYYYARDSAGGQWRGTEAEGWTGKIGDESLRFKKISVPPINGVRTISVVCSS